MAKRQTPVVILVLLISICSLLVRWLDREQPEVMRVDVKRIAAKDVAVDGVQVDMSKGKVLALWGKPPEVIPGELETWNYPQEGRGVIFDERGVSSVGGGELRLGSQVFAAGLPVEVFLEQLYLSSGDQDSESIQVACRDFTLVGFKHRSKVVGFNVIFRHLERSR